MTALHEAMGADDEVSRRVDYYVDTQNLSYSEALALVGAAHLAEETAKPFEHDLNPGEKNSHDGNSTPTMREILDTPVTPVGVGRQAAREMTAAVGNGDEETRLRLLTSGYLRHVIIED